MRYDRHYRMTSTPRSNKHLAIPAVIGLLCVGLLFAALAASVNTKPYMPPNVAQKYMEEWLIESSRHVAGEVRLKHIQNIEPFYLHRDYQPVWMDSYELKPAAKELIQVLRETAGDDWRNYGYALPTLERETNRLSNVPKQATAVDILLTDAFITYAQQSLNSELIPDTGELDHPIRKVSSEQPLSSITTEDVVRLLQKSVEDDNLDELLTQLTPNQPGYLKLREQLNRYRAIDATGLWEELPADMQVSEGQRHKMMPYLRWVLGQYGDMPKGALSWLFKEKESHSQWPLEGEEINMEEPRFLFDEPLKEAVMHFQKRHKLEVTGELNDETRLQLNIPPYQIAQRIALNMKRWRHLPRELGQRHIMVNMADFRLRLMDGNTPTLDMKVVIGNLQRRTPVMSEMMSTIEISPTWTVPARIAATSLLPQIKRNPAYLEQKGFRVITYQDGAPKYVSTKDINWNKYSSKYFPYTLVQQPGPHNALGTVKFLFPNLQDIYLHDTSHRELFALEKRALSSGCVRVEQPRLLAEKLLARQTGWQRSNIDAAIDQNRTSRIRLEQPVPVYLMYWTTWVDDDGVLQVREDVYQRDLTAGMASHRQASL